MPSYTTSEQKYIFRPKKYILWTFTCLITLLTISSAAQQSTITNEPHTDSAYFEHIKTCFTQGNTNQIMLLCTGHVDMTMLNKSGVYSQNQASVILATFFKNNPPELFTIDKVSHFNQELFLTGRLKTKNETFRVYLQTKLINYQNIIYQIRIEN